jgi:hypothetical protein
MFIKNEAIQKRSQWIEKIALLENNFSENAKLIEKELQEEILKFGSAVLLDHIRLCGDIPESYSHDSTQEKLYSKYTDALLSETFKYIGLKSFVLEERADAADVDVFFNINSNAFVADAKSFRLSRTAKNQKDFKVQAMNNWKRDKQFAMVVCPIYQLPTRSSQIYEQATSLNVCILSYSHLAILINIAETNSKQVAEKLLHNIFDAIVSSEKSKDANHYWKLVNNCFLKASENFTGMWAEEKIVAKESIQIAKDLAINFLVTEKSRILKFTKEEAIEELLKIHKIDSKMTTINDVESNEILECR